MLVAGVIGQALRPETEVAPSAQIGTTVAFVPAEVLAYAPDGHLVIDASSEIAVHAGRQSDADAWLGGHTTTVVGEMTEWTTLTTTVAKRDTEASDATGTSGDIWRQSWEGAAPMTLSVAEVPPGLGLVVQAAGGGVIDTIELRFEREVNDGWISPMLVAGTVLTAIGLLAAIFRLVDIRPLQERMETRRAEKARTRKAKDDAHDLAGTRRSRRLKGDGMTTTETVEVDET